MSPHFTIHAIHVFLKRSEIPLVLASFLWFEVSKRCEKESQPLTQKREMEDLSNPLFLSADMA